MHYTHFSRLWQLATLLFLLSAVSIDCRNRLASTDLGTTMTLQGRWKKITMSACSQAYPALIEFKANGLYSAESDPKAPVHPVWDVGTFAVEPGQVQLSTSNDAVITYKTAQTRKQISFQAPDGCTITYEKL